jgi:exodeoxyribonuclease VII large subunit
VSQSPGAGRRRRVYSVTEFLSGLNALFEDRVGRVWVAGELTNLHRAPSGHSYFTLKDESGQIRAVLFRSASGRVPFELEEGLEVLAYADASIYAARGDVQLVVKQLEPIGRGALQLAFEQLRARLEQEGLFDAARKRPLPEFPTRVGVVTSPTSAAVRDIIHVSERRAPSVPLLISPTRVQGVGSEDEIAAAIDRIAVQPGVEVLLLVRGGGSLEDLWAFNTETVARAIARCPLPLISGVGHETDVTIADLVADQRAATPSAAAALALPDRSGLVASLQRDWRRLSAGIRNALRSEGVRLARERDALRMLAPSARLAQQRRRLLEAHRGLGRATLLAGERRQAQLARLSDRLQSLSPLAVLGRGYALVRREPDAEIVRRPAQVSLGDRIVVQLAEGRIRARVESAEPEPEAPG